MYICLLMQTVHLHSSRKFNIINGFGVTLNDVALLFLLWILFVRNIIRFISKYTDLSSWSWSLRLQYSHVVTVIQSAIHSLHWVLYICCLALVPRRLVYLYVGTKLPASDLSSIVKGYIHISNSTWLYFVVAHVHLGDESALDLCTGRLHICWQVTYSMCDFDEICRSKLKSCWHVKIIKLMTGMIKTACMQGSLSWQVLTALSELLTEEFNSEIKPVPV